MRKFELGEKVIVNTGGEDSEAYIDHPNVRTYLDGSPRSFYMAEHDAYLCRFTKDIKHTFFGGAVKGSSNEKDFLAISSQYIPVESIRKFGQ